MNAKRISRTSEFIANASITIVFPLFGPIEEMKWDPDWKPKIVCFERSIPEERMMFTSPARFEDEHDYVWIITRFDPEKHIIEYTVSSEHRTWFIDVRCIEENEYAPRVRVTYTYTSLTERGAELNTVSLESMFKENLADWARAINSYLEKNPLHSR